MTLGADRWQASACPSQSCAACLCCKQAVARPAGSMRAAVGRLPSRSLTCQPCEAGSCSHPRRVGVGAAAQHFDEDIGGHRKCRSRRGIRWEHHERCVLGKEQLQQHERGRGVSLSC